MVLLALINALFQLENAALEKKRENKWRLNVLCYLRDLMFVGLQVHVFHDSGLITVIGKIIIKAAGSTVGANLSNSFSMSGEEI